MSVEQIINLYCETTDVERKRELEAEMLRVLDPKIITVSRKFTRNEELEEVYQIAKIGFVLCMRAYERAHKTKFLTYAYTWVNGYIMNQLRNTGAVVRQPGYLRDFMIRKRMESDKYTSATGEAPSDRVLAHRMGIDYAKYIDRSDKARYAPTIPQSIEQVPVNEQGIEQELHQQEMMVDIYGRAYNKAPSQAMQLFDELLEKRRNGASAAQIRKEYNLPPVRCRDLVEALDGYLAV